MSRKLAGNIMLGLVIAILLWDVLLWQDVVRHNTISEIVARASARHPGLTFAVGFLCGHMFWPVRIKEKSND